MKLGFAQFAAQASKMPDWPPSRERTPGPDDVYDPDMPDRGRTPGPDDVYDPDMPDRGRDSYSGPDGSYDGGGTYGPLF